MNSMKNYELTRMFCLRLSPIILFKLRVCPYLLPHCCTLDEIHHKVIVVSFPTQVCTFFAHI